MPNKLDPIAVADQIWKAIQALGAEGQRLESDNLIQNKANTMGEYDKQRGLATAELKIKGEPTTLIPKQADGRVSDLLIKKVVAEETLKAHYSKIERLQAQLNGLQSLNKYLEHIPNT